MGEPQNDRETYVLNQCATAFALLDIEKDHVAVVRIFTYLHTRFRDEALHRMDELHAQMAQAFRDYNTEKEKYEDAAKEEAAKAVPEEIHAASNQQAERPGGA